ncbi:T9SS type A sorting domain-containing protein [Hymenobacter sp. 15J16-1T3B]|uniref:T9SS type A sorting domain-containing protein n=1 Tax=Hymenobacter sp. 15J16-1T3B TaxID=2886941 RepID=UPI001D12A5C7|nr:T9SS type A sorting domain-containing protein [Hymenobacter sp. 15J16-1T3B]MCC3156830.1 T9SS type A sorting domain-containing protein [Hymenobacter sp. 15J16-1T3B]
MYTFTAARCLTGWALLLAALAASPSLAQTTTAPAWGGASQIGPGPIYVTRSAVDAAGNTYQVSTFTNALTLGGTSLTSVGNTDAYLAKFTASGTLAWIRQLGSAGFEAGNDLVLDAAGNVYITGNYTNAISLGNGLSLTDGGGTSNKLFVVRYSPQGTPEWAQQSQLTTTGSTAVGSGIGLDAAGNVHVAGYFGRNVSIGSSSVSTTTFQPGNFLARFAGGTGTLLSLVKAFEYGPSTGTATYTYPVLAVAPTGEDYLLNHANQPAIFGGTTYSSRGGNDVLVARYSAQGALEWVQQAGGAADDRMRRARTDAAGNLYIAGYFTGPAQFGTTTLPGAGDYDGFLLKYSSQGVMQWVQPGGGPGSDGFGDVVLDAAGNAYVTGNFDGTAQYGPATLTSAGSRDATVAAYTPQGQLRWVQQAGGTGFDVAYDLGFDGAGYLRVVGRFEGTCVFGPATLTVATGSELFLARLGTTPLAVRPAVAAQALAFYPNPAHDQVQLPGLPAGSAVQLVDALGRVARATRVAAGAVSVQGLPAGLYTLRATDAQSRPVSGRVLVQ